MPASTPQFEKITNFRDLAGLKTPDGRSIPAGKLFRSGHLADLTDRDCSRLSELVSVIADFRSYKEKESQPDRNVPGTEYFHIPIIDDLTAGITREEGSDQTAFALLLGKPKEAREYMCRTYEDFALNAYANEQYAGFLRILQQPHEKAVLWHCTAGKDRAGIGAVLVEEILGISREEIMADYNRTNEYIAEDIRFLTDMIKKKMSTDSPLVDESLQYLFGAKEEYLLSFYDAVSRRHGSMNAFLQNGLGVTAEARAAMQKMYLE